MTTSSRELFAKYEATVPVQGDVRVDPCASRHSTIAA